MIKDDLMLGTRESKIEATHRLQREGRWDLASQYRERERVRLKSEGHKRAVAGEEAWRLMIDRFRHVDDEAEILAYSMLSCPAKITGFEEERHDFNTAWATTLSLIAYLAPHDAFLRRAIFEGGPDRYELRSIGRLLTHDEEAVIRKAYLDSEKLLDEKLESPLDLLAWAEPILAIDFDTMDPDLLQDDDYQQKAVPLLGRVVRNWLVLEDSVEVFHQVLQAIAEGRKKVA